MIDVIFKQLLSKSCQIIPFSLKSPEFDHRGLIFANCLASTLLSVVLIPHLSLIELEWSIRMKSVCYFKWFYLKCLLICAANTSSNDRDALLSSSRVSAQNKAKTGHWQQRLKYALWCCVFWCVFCVAFVCNIILLLFVIMYYIPYDIMLFLWKCLLPHFMT